MKLETWFFKPSYRYNFDNLVFLKGSDFSNLPILEESFESFFLSKFDDSKLSFDFLVDRRFLSQAKDIIPLAEIRRTTSLDVFNRYFEFRFSSFIFFFNLRRISIPLSFVGVKSLRRLNFELPLLKFSNFLMTGGDRERIFKAIAIGFQLNLTDLKASSFFYNSNLLPSWIKFYHLFTANFNRKNLIVSFSDDDYLNTNFDHFFLRYRKHCSSTFFIKPHFIDNLIIVQPLFHFSVYNVDKNIKKFSRNKTSKYVFIWKYIPLYKRNLLALKLAAKEIKFNSNYRFQTRIATILKIFRINPQSSYAWKINQFSHNYVFKHFTKSLMLTLKSTS